MSANIQPSIDWEAIEQALVDWVRDVVKLEAIFTEDGGPQPNRPYVSLDWLVPPSSVGDDYWVQTTNATTKEIDRQIEGVRDSTLTVAVHTNSKAAGKNAMFYADVLANSLASDSIVRRWFYPVRMAPWDWEPIRKGSFVEDTKTVSRAMFDMRLGFSAGVDQPSETIPYITRVALTGNVSTPETTFTKPLSVTS